MVDIASLGLGDSVRHKRLGKGKVIECTEKPSIRVEFSNGGRMNFTQQTAYNLFEIGDKNGNK